MAQFRPDEISRTYWSEVIAAIDEFFITPNEAKEEVYPKGRRWYVEPERSHLTVTYDQIPEFMRSFVKTERVEFKMSDVGRTAVHENRVNGGWIIYSPYPVEVTNEGFVFYRK